MAVRIIAPDSPLHATVSLPASKSISNRALIIQALADESFDIQNLSEAEDTKVLVRLLSQTSNEYYCGEGGTTLRFLMAYLAARGGKYTITAAPSLKVRPHIQLLTALKQLGCRITFNEQENRLPLILESKGLKSSGVLEIPGDISSQFISALMLVGPYIENGITIRITGEMISYPYLRMTARVMEAFGEVPVFNDSTITISPGKYRASPYTIEPDWSAASYWYEMVALKPGSEITLKDLHCLSIQGDADIAGVMHSMGVQTDEDGAGIRIRNVGNTLHEILLKDLSGCPDTAPALISTCAGLNLTADFLGLKNFRLKESDRAAAFQRELYNFGVNTDFCGGSKFKIYSGNSIHPNKRVIKTYHDHRVAMAMAPLSLVAGAVLIDDESVVSKSYPGYFEDLERAGFRIEKI